MRYVYKNTGIVVESENTLDSAMFLPFPEKMEVEEPEVEEPVKKEDVEPEVEEPVKREDVQPRTAGRKRTTSGRK